MKILMVYPRYPDTFWSLKQALRIISKKAAFPPLGLLTVASLLPKEWEKKLVDMNVTKLNDSDLKWADYVFISAMVVQWDSVKEVVRRCKSLNVKMVAGGPLFTNEPDKFEEIDHLVLDEAEITLKPFLADMASGTLKHIYTSMERPDLSMAPIPMWSLINQKKYATLNAQYSRGCPFDCDFCNIGQLYGHNVRTKSKEHSIAELDAIYNAGWRGRVFIVDDNFIGNKKKLKQEILPAMIEWQKQHNHPFTMLTQASINLSDDEEVMDMMTEAGFDSVFVGIESPNEESLEECHKKQNEHRDLTASVVKMQNHGLQVQAGFIVGFDNDPISVFKSQINLVQRSGIVVAMVGLLNAPRGTKLHQRMEKENRLITSTSGDNTDGSMNFVPKMDLHTLVSGYRDVLTKLYSPKPYYERVNIFLKEYKPLRRKGADRLQWWQVWTIFRASWLMGVIDSGRLHYWRFFFSTLFKRPRSFPLGMTLAIYGYHFWTLVRRVTRVPVSTPTV